jgi:hypothetical protein
MKDAKGHGSDPHNGSSHMDGINKIGRVPIQPGLWYHGSPLGEPGIGPIHVGTATAAKQALEARIGIPADGRGWNGDREYGKTLLAGQDTQAKLGKTGYNVGTGFNCGPGEWKGKTVPGAPKEDYYPTQRTERATMGGSKDGPPVPFTARPAVRAYEIAGNMSNNTYYPTTDTRANAMSGRLKNQGTYYKNEGEDSGSISAVVPNKEFLRRKA